MFNQSRRNKNTCGQFNLPTENEQYSETNVRNGLTTGSTITPLLITPLVDGLRSHRKNASHTPRSSVDYIYIYVCINTYLYIYKFATLSVRFSVVNHIFERTLDSDKEVRRETSPILFCKKQSYRSVSDRDRYVFLICVATSKSYTTKHTYNQQHLPIMYVYMYVIDNIHIPRN